MPRIRILPVSRQRSDVVPGPAVRYDECLSRRVDRIHCTPQVRAAGRPGAAGMTALRVTSCFLIVPSTASKATPRARYACTFVMIMRCTAKARDLFGLRQLAEPDPFPDDWYVNLLSFDRRKCLLLAHGVPVSCTPTACPMQCSANWRRDRAGKDREATGARLHERDDQVRRVRACRPRRVGSVRHRRVQSRAAADAAQPRRNPQPALQASAYTRAVAGATSSMPTAATASWAWSGFGLRKDLGRFDPDDHLSGRLPRR